MGEPAISHFKQLTTMEKGQMMGLIQSGMKLTAISELTGRSVSTIFDYKKRLLDDVSFDRKEGTKRARKTTAEQDDAIVQLALNTPFINAGLIKEKMPDVQVSERTVTRRLRAGGLRNFKAVRKPFLKPKNIAARLAWAREHLDWTRRQWNRVIWSDESPFYLRDQSQNLFGAKLVIIHLIPNLFKVLLNIQAKLWFGLASQDKDQEVFTGFNQQMKLEIRKPWMVNTTERSSMIIYLQLLVVIFQMEISSSSKIMIQNTLPN